VSPENDLILAAARLARTAPENWRLFSEVFSAYTSNQISNCVKSSLEELPRAQGRAQAVAHLYGLLSDCLASADKIEGKRK
jgi:hypothetical protein